MFQVLNPFHVIYSVVYSLVNVRIQYLVLTIVRLLPSPMSTPGEVYSAALPRVKARGF